MSSDTIAEEAAERYLENVVYFKGFVNKGLSKGDLLKLLHLAIEYPLEQKEQRFLDRKTESLAALIRQIIKDKTLLTIAGMGGSFSENTNETKEIV